MTDILIILKVIFEVYFLSGGPLSSFLFQVINKVIIHIFLPSLSVMRNFGRSISSKTCFCLITDQGLSPRFNGLTFAQIFGFFNIEFMTDSIGI